MSSPNNVSVGYYAPEIGSESLSAPDYCLKKLIEEYDEGSKVERVVFIHNSEKLPSWLPRSQVVVLPRTPGCLERQINGTDVDVVHLNRYFDLLNPYLLDSPIILTYHGDLQWEYPELTTGTLRPWLMRAVEVAKIPTIDEVVFVSENLRTRVENRFQIFPLNAHTIYNGVDHQLYRELPENSELKYGGNQPFILHASNLTDKKNPDVLIDAYSQVADKTDVDLIICGSGWKESEEVTNLLSRLGLLDRVHRAGYVPEEELIQLYNQATLFVFPSKHETFGLPVVEAMACGTPVVTSDVYCLPEITGGNAELCSPESSIALAESMLKLIGDNQKRQTLVQNGLRRSKEFEWEGIADEYWDLYNSMISKQ